MNPDANSQYKPPFKGERGFAFEHGEEVGVAQFDFDGVDRALAGERNEDDSRGERLETMSRLIRWLADGRTVLQTGRFVHILEHLQNPTLTQGELARKMGMDEGQLSRQVKTAREILINGFKDN